MNRPRKLTRIEKGAEIRRRLFDAATKIVGELGYAETSVTRITEAAGVASGTFYNHFENRQALFDELLPTLGMEMAKYIQSKTEGIAPESERELARFAVFLEYLDLNPGFSRILNEAEFCAPRAFQKHMDNMARPYRRMLREARERGELDTFTDDEIEVIVEILLGARSYLSRTALPDAKRQKILMSSYKKLTLSGLFKGTQG